MQMYPVERAALAELEAGLARREASAGANAGNVAPRKEAGGVALRVKQVVKRYDGRTVLHDVALDVAAGEFLAIVGRSGCGKSTLLRLVAGLEAADGGSIAIDGDSAATGRARPADVRVMFQDARLLPWKRVLVVYGHAD
ncbi:MAG: ATP-binding cassette domain-containing protein, partial [Cupriavidus sp.]|nr:ATP-binding cassette domain-containing protein [Cupriavidus sp.]